MKKVYWFLPLALLLGSLFVTDARAQFRIGPHAGLNIDGTDVFIGGSAQFNVHIGDYTFIGNPGLDLYFLIDNVTITRINADLLYPFQTASLQPYVGAGVLLQFSSFDLPEDTPSGVESSDLDFGLNLKIGTIFTGGDSSFKPFVEGTAALGNSSDLALRGGIYFTLGG
jgi:hypothetical protein